MVVTSVALFPMLKQPTATMIKAHAAVHSEHNDFLQCTELLNEDVSKFHTTINNMNQPFDRLP